MPFIDGTNITPPTHIKPYRISGRNDSTGNPSNKIYMDFGNLPAGVQSDEATNQIADLISAILAIHDAINKGLTDIWLETTNTTTHKYLLSTGGDVAHLRALVAAAVALAGRNSVNVKLIRKP